jgi:glycerol-3-phosphate O-acyltransferase
VKSGSMVTIPVWLAILLGSLGAFAIIDRLFLPLVRWWLHRPVSRTIDDIGQRLKLRIPRFKLAPRRVVIAQLMCDPDVLKAVKDEAKARDEPMRVSHARAKRYAKEIVPAYSAYAYFRVGTGLAKWLSTAIYRVRLGAFEEARLDQVPQDATVVFVINHRSNMDYALITALLSQSSALSYAVGEWGRVMLLQSLIRAMGSYFVRRESSSAIYRKVLARYVHTAIASGVTQAVFPEGGLTLDGKLRPPKLGLLSYMVAGFDPNGTRDVVFVPVGINYDHVLEDELLTAAASTPAGERPHFSVPPLALTAWVANELRQRIRGTWERYGYACVGFGHPVSLRGYLGQRGVDLRALPEEQRFAEIAQLGQCLMREVGHVVPALPVPLVSTAPLAAGEALSDLQLDDAVRDLMRRLKSVGAYVLSPSHGQQVGDVGLRMLMQRRLVTGEAGVYRLNRGATALLTFYANSIAHLLAGDIGVQSTEGATVSSADSTNGSWS